MMGKTTIEWCDFTFNPFIGCTKVSQGCDHCYAEAFVSVRLKQDFSVRRRTSRANWRNMEILDMKAVVRGVRPRVFCASLADVFDNQVPEEWRRDLWSLIGSTPNLDWLLLTKRPQNIAKMLPSFTWGDGWPNVWLGTTVENQEEADRRIPLLLAIPAVKRFLSCEPMLGPVSLYLPHANWATNPANARETADVVDWVICGGESGPDRRPMDLAWARSLRDQCASGRIPFFMKQIDKVQPIPDDLMIRQFP